MTLKLLQLNINGDNYWDKLIPYLTSHDFDIIHLQEVTGKNTIAGNLKSQRDCFEELQEILKNYKNAFSICQRYTSSPDAYLGTATFYKKNFSLKEQKIITLYKRDGLFPSNEKTFEDVGRTVVHIKLEIDNKTISFLNTHLAWAKTPKEEPHQTQQGEILLNYLQTVPHPFILTGDFNLDPKQPLIQKINKLARNLTEENHVINTLNPRTHRAKMLFPPGVTVDYMFVTPDVTVKSFSIIQDDLSDHLGLTAKIEV